MFNTSTAWPALIIFDCDGVLIDSEQIACAVLASALQDEGVDIDAATIESDFIGRSLASLIGEFAQRGVTLPEQFVPALNVRLRDAFSESLQPIAGIAQLLQRLRIPVCVASSSQIERVRFTLTLTGLVGYFGTHLYTAESVVHGKPAPDLFLYAARQMNTRPADCLVIEDSVFGVRAARAASMRAWGFTGGSHLEGSESAAATLRDAGAENVFSDMTVLASTLPAAVSR